MIDLDAARAQREAARREADGKGPIVKLGGAEYELSPEMPYGVLEALVLVSDEDKAAGALTDLTKSLLGEHYESFLDAELSMDDVNELLGGVLREYGMSSPLDSSSS